MMTSLNITYEILPFFCFRNIYCALCNGVVPSVYTVLAYESRWLSPSEIYSFSGLLKWNIKEEAMIAQNLKCSLGFIYDVVLVSLKHTL